jgi:DeoR family transcriptional regulator, glycerol-3-phosphate regulon repressor
MDFDTNDLNERQSLIVDRVNEHGFVTIETLAKDLDVSAQTVRREIIRLDDAGLIQRFHGGAGRSQSAERQSYQTKLNQQADLKRRIGAAMAAELRDGQCVFLDVGTTVEAVARALADRRDLTVVTCSLAVAQIVQALGTHKVVVSGGTLAGPDGSLVGPQALTVVENFRFHWAVIACSGIDEEATALDFDAEKVAVKKAAIKRTRNAALVADSSKFLRPAVTVIAPIASFAMLVTDTRMPPSVSAHVGEARIKIAA